LYPLSGTDTVAVVNGYKTQQSEGTWTLSLRLDRYLDLVAAKGWGTQAEQAEGLRVSQQSISRMLAGLQTPGPSLIAHLMQTFSEQADFNDLFEIVAIDEPVRRAS
jgi:transcriptional regulator with XRE-family HTH domain